MNLISESTRSVGEGTQTLGWGGHGRRAMVAAATAAALAVLVLAQPASATLPGRNGLLAFTADTGQGSQIYTVDARGRHLRKITRVAGSAIAPHWSPDARRIVFELDDPDGSCRIGVMNADGSGLRFLTGHDRNVCDANPTFTPDGRRILLNRDIGVASCNTPGGACIVEGAIWSMNLRGGDRRRITNGVGYAAAPEVSPDGTLISFDSSISDSGSALFVSRIDGSHLVRLTPYAFDVAYKHEWSPDGRHIVFTAHAPGNESALNVATIARDGSDLRFLTSYQAPDTGFSGSYSPDGRWIVYRAEQGGQSALLAITPDTSTQLLILGFSALRPRYITWGPAVR